MDDGLLSDDRAWEQVWDQTLSHVERHAIAMAVVRRRLPRTPLEGRVALELARRWSRQAVTLGIVYAVWSLFWGAIAWDSIQRYGAGAGRVAIGCCAVGLAAITCCVLFRQRMRSFRAAHRGAPAKMPIP
jgi:hypothetical protein